MHLWLTVAKWLDASVGTQDADAPLKKVDWVRIIPFIAMHAACLAVLLVGWSWIAVAIAAGLYLARMFALTGFYHRYFSHRTFRTSRPVQFLFALWGSAAVQRGPLWWAAHHRTHHRHSDTEKDPHSPIAHGFWWSHMGWITSRVNYPTNFKAVRDLARFPELRFLDRFDMLVPFCLAAALLTTGMILKHFAPSLGTSGPQMLIWGFFVSTVVLFHATCLINSMAHKVGRRPFDTDDESRNSLMLALVTLGEGWHNNHHYYPHTVRQGFRWWQIDITYYFLKILSWTGLIWDLRQVPARILATSRTSRPGRAGIGMVGSAD